MEQLIESLAAALCGFVLGGLTVRVAYRKSIKAGRSANVVDQSGAIAARDIVGRDKTEAR